MGGAGNFIGVGNDRSARAMAIAMAIGKAMQAFVEVAIRAGRNGRTELCAVGRIVKEGNG